MVKLTIPEADAKQQFLAAYQKCLSEGLSQTEAAAKALKTIQGHVGQRGQGGCCGKNMPPFLYEVIFFFLTVG